MERITVWMARVGFLSIAACTFGLSFDAIRDVAQSTGAVDPDLAWIVPLAVDGMIVTATAVLWTESLSGRGWHMFPLAAIIGPAALSMWANIAHASGESLLAQVLAAVPPAGLILSLELVAWQIRRERKSLEAAQEAGLAAPGAARGPRAAGPGVAAAVAGPFVAATRPRPASSTATASRPAPSTATASRAASPMSTSAAPSSASAGAPTAAPPPASDGDGRRPADQPSSADPGERDASGAQPAHQEAMWADESVRIDRDEDTGRITLDIPQQHRGKKEVWSRIIAAVQQSGTVPTQRQLADELDVPRSRVQREIQRNRDQWEELTRQVDGDDADEGHGDRDVDAVASGSAAT
jgi:hypothetical protein